MPRRTARVADVVAEIVADVDVQPLVAVENVSDFVDALRGWSGSGVVPVTTEAVLRTYAGATTELVSNFQRVMEEIGGPTDAATRAVQRLGVAARAAQGVGMRRVSVEEDYRRVRPWMRFVLENVRVWALARGYVAGNPLENNGVCEFDNEFEWGILVVDGEGGCGFDVRVRFIRTLGAGVADSICLTVKAVGSGVTPEREDVLIYWPLDSDGTGHIGALGGMQALADSAGSAVFNAIGAWFMMWGGEGVPVGASWDGCSTREPSVGFPYGRCFCGQAYGVDGRCPAGPDVGVDLTVE